MRARDAGDGRRTQHSHVLVTAVGPPESTPSRSASPCGSTRRRSRWRPAATRRTAGTTAPSRWPSQARRRPGSLEPDVRRWRRCSVSSRARAPMSPAVSAPGLRVSARRRRRECRASRADSNGWYNHAVDVGPRDRRDFRSRLVLGLVATGAATARPQSSGATCTDNAGNTSAVATLGLKYDATPPAVTANARPRTDRRLVPEAGDSQLRRSGRDLRDRGLHGARRATRAPTATVRR